MPKILFVCPCMAYRPYHITLVTSILSCSCTPTSYYPEYLSQTAYKSYSLCLPTVRDHSGLWQKKALKKSALPRKKKHIFSKEKAPILPKKSTFEAEKKTLSKHYFINKKQQESTYNLVIQLVLYLHDKVSQGKVPSTV